MKQRNQKTIDLNEQIFVYIGGKRYVFANIKSVVEWLSHSHKNYIEDLWKGRFIFIEKITDAMHSPINKDYFYWMAYKEVNKKRSNKKKELVYLEEKNYFRARKQSVCFEDDPKARAKVLVDRGPFWYDDPYYRRTEKCWKNYRMKQYK